MKAKNILKRFAEMLDLVKENPTMTDVHVVAGGGYGRGKRKKKPADERMTVLAARDPGAQVEDEIILRMLGTERAQHAHYFQKAQHAWPGQTTGRCLVCGGPVAKGMEKADAPLCTAAPADQSHIPDLFRHVYAATDKAEWDAATVDALPDSSFAIVLDSATKARKLPYKDASGKIGLPQLRSALSRIPGADLSPDQRAKARRTLEEARAKVAQKDEDGLTILKASEEQKVWLVVSEPGEEDTQGDVISEQDISKAAHEFLVRYRKGETRLRLQHAADLVDEQARLVEHYIAPVDFIMGEERVKKGSWVQGWHIPDAGIWNATKAGRFTGASLGGTGVREDRVEA